MSSVQSPPVTVITVPPATTTTTEATTTTTVPPEPVTTVTTAVVETPPAVGGDDVPEDGLVLLVFLGIASLVALVVGVMWAFRRRRADVAARLEVAPPVHAALADRIREVADRSQSAEPGSYSPAIDDISIADLYPWLEAGDDLTLVVDLTTAEALQKVGVTSLAQLAELDDERAEVLSDAGIEIDAASVIAAQDILSRRSDEQR